MCLERTKLPLTSLSRPQVPMSVPVLLLLIVQPDWRSMRERHRGALESCPSQSGPRAARVRLAERPEAACR